MHVWVRVGLKMDWGRTGPTSRSERLVEEAFLMKGFPTQKAKEAGVVLSVRIAD